MHSYYQFRKEMRTRGRKSYWRAKLKTIGTIIAWGILVVLFIAVMFGYMLAFPD